MEEKRIYDEDYDMNGFLEKSKIHRNGTRYDDNGME